MKERRISLRASAGHTPPRVEPKGAKAGFRFSRHGLAVALAASERVSSWMVKASPYSRLQEI